MRLENYGVAAFDDAGPDLGDIATVAEPPASSPGEEGTAAEMQAAAVAAAPLPSPSLNELAQQATPFTPGTPPSPDAAPYEPPAAIAQLLTQPTWQGFSVTAAPDAAVASPAPGIDAATFARIESMAGRDSSAGRGSGGGFGGFGGFGGADGGDTESWQYTYEGIDGAPDVIVNVNYSGGVPVSSNTYGSFNDDSAASVTPITPSDIGSPTPADLSEISGETGGLPSAPTVAVVDDGGSEVTSLPAAAPAAPTPGPTGASEAVAAPAPSSPPAPSSAPAPAPAPAPPSANGPVVGQNRDGANIIAVGGYQPNGTIVPVSDAPVLPAGDPNLPADARGATPMRDDGGNGTLLYRIDGGKDDGVIRQIIPAQASSPAPADAQNPVTAPTTPPAGTSTADTALATTGLALTAAQTQQLTAVNNWLLSTGRAAVTTLAEAAAAVGEGLRAVEAGAVIVSELAVAAVAVGINLVLVAPTPDLVTPLGDTQRFVTRPGDHLGTLQERGPDGEWRDIKQGVALYTLGQQRVALTDDEAAALLQPLINVPAPPGPVSPPPSTPTDASLPLLHGQPITDGTPPALDGLPVLEPRTAEDLIITRNADNNRQRAQDSHTAEPTLADPSSLAGRHGPNGVGTWVYPDQPRGNRGADYEEQCTGTPSGIELNVGGNVALTPNGAVTATGGANFDGVTVDSVSGRTVLIDTKDWASFALPKAKFWVGNVTGQAQQQLDAVASSGLQADIEWHVSTADTAQKISQTLANAGISGIRVVTVPKKGP